MSLLKYVRTAFQIRWNLLALFGGVGFAVLSGRPDITLPLVAAAEIGFLTLLGTHPKFQRAVDAQGAATERERNSQTANAVLRQILKQLPAPFLTRYERLRASCHDLRQIADDLKQSGTLESGQPLESFQIAGLDRLMWIFLRLMFTQFSMGKFLERTNRDRIVSDIEQAQMRLREIPPTDESPHAQKMRRTLQDNVHTCQERLANFEKAQANYEFVGHELNRLENKIKSLAELGVNRQEPDFISSQVDTVARSLLDTEKTMNDLQFATGLAPLNDETPDMIQQPLVQSVRKS
ncbi:MAG: hypothetical protein IAG10_04740 [Planctomycetaceae bacterium]|nr:hypothetical protein [Planctomycetaceae bacterium]